MASTTAPRGPLHEFFLVLCYIKDTVRVEGGAGAARRVRTRVKHQLGVSFPTRANPCRSCASARGSSCSALLSELVREKEEIQEQIRAVRQGAQEEELHGQLDSITLRATELEGRFVLLQRAVWALHDHGVAEQTDSTFHDAMTAVEAKELQLLQRRLAETSVRKELELLQTTDDGSDAGAQPAGDANKKEQCACTHRNNKRRIYDPFE